MPVDGSFGVCDGRVDERHRAVLGFDEPAELGAREDYGLRAALDKVRDRSLELLPQLARLRARSSARRQAIRAIAIDRAHATQTPRSICCLQELELQGVNPDPEPENSLGDDRDDKPKHESGNGPLREAAGLTRRNRQLVRDGAAALSRNEGGGQPRSTANSSAAEQ